MSIKDFAILAKLGKHLIMQARELTLLSIRFNDLLIINNMH